MILLIFEHKLRVFNDKPLMICYLLLLEALLSKAPRKVGNTVTLAAQNPAFMLCYLFICIETTSKELEAISIHITKICNLWFYDRYKGICEGCHTSRQRKCSP